MSFGTLLANERRTQGYSQHYLADLAETTQRHLSFLETGRAKPTRAMILRLGEALGLSPARRGVFFEAGGFISPYVQRSMSDADIASILDVIEHRILANWPYAAFAFTHDWDILLSNASGAGMIGTTPDALKSGNMNMFDVLLAPEFRGRIHNWEQCSTAIYVRMRARAAQNIKFAARLENALARGVLSSNLNHLLDVPELPAILPIELIGADGKILRTTSITARFNSVHDEFVSGIEIELMMPLD